MQSKVKIEGLRELSQKSDAFKKHLFSQFGEIVKEGADMIRDEAKAKAPTGDTGNLKKGITSTITWDKQKSKAFAGVGMDAGMNDVFVKYSANGKRYYYPSSVEYGHKPNKESTARPFLRPALKKKRNAVKKLIASKVGALIGGFKP